MLPKALLAEIEGHYRIFEPVSRGSYGWVFRGETRDEHLPVAIKIFTEKAAIYANSLNELRLLFRLRHRHIVKLLDLLYLQHGYVLIFEFISGGDLRRVLETQGRLSERAVLAMATQIASGLAYVHDRQIIHLDLKPENILVQRSEDEICCKIADFNNSRSHANSADANNQGSPLYMAPEQFYTHCDHRSDLYSLGVMLFEMLTGDTPFMGDTASLMKAHLQAPVPWERCTASPLTRSILERLLAKDPGQRFAQASSLVTELEFAQEQLTHEDRQVSPSGIFYLKYLAPEIQQALLASAAGLPEKRLQELQQRNAQRWNYELNHSPSSRSRSDSPPVSTSD